MDLSGSFSRFSRGFSVTTASRTRVSFYVMTFQQKYVYNVMKEYKVHEYVTPEKVFRSQALA